MFSSSIEIAIRRSLMQVANRSDPNIDPCATPVSSALSSDFLHSLRHADCCLNVVNH